MTATQVDNRQGGSASAQAWTLTATGPNTFTGASGAPAVTNATVGIGTYQLTESGGPAAFTAGPGPARPGPWTATG